MSSVKRDEWVAAEEESEHPSLEPSLRQTFWNGFNNAPFKEPEPLTADSIQKAIETLLDDSRSYEWHACRIGCQHYPVTPQQAEWLKKQSPEVLKSLGIL